MEDDLIYYQRRARDEDEAVRRATCQQARDRHLELAAAYRLRCVVNSNSIADDADDDEEEGDLDEPALLPSVTSSPAIKLTLPQRRRPFSERAVAQIGSDRGE
jgi:hypothetical protein